MSADNRLIIHRHTDDKWYVWEGSFSCYYHSPPFGHPSLKKFIEEDEAWEYAHEHAQKNYLEYGYGILDKDEIIGALRDELDQLRSDRDLIASRISDYA